MRGSKVTLDATAPVAVGVLGPFEVSVDGQAIRLPSGRLRVLLAVLALHAGQPVAPDRVVDAVWATNPPADVRRTLRTYLARLRAALGSEAIENNRSGPVLQTPPDCVDALRFQQLIDEAARERGTEHATLVEALNLWRGRAFEDLDSAWLRESEAAKLDERRLAALERRIDLDLVAGRHDRLIAELQELATAYPLRESLWARYLQALSGAGRTAEALERYEEIRTRIADTLGVDPGAELRGLHAALLEGESAGAPAGETAPAEAADPATPAPSIPRQLPADLVRFAGREAALRSLDAVLADHGDQPIVVAITGVGGVGKTSLATHWAHRAADHFPDGVIYLNLRGYGRGTPLTPAAALDAILRGLGATAQEIPTDAETRASALRSRLADRRVLIVLDNARDADQVRQLLPGAGPALVVVTSRSQLRSLVAREGARRIALDTFEPSDSMALLAATLDTQRVTYDEPALAELADRCGHLPLALVIAAERAGRDHELGLAELVEELRDRQDRLPALDVGDGESTDLRAVFAWSYDALDEDTARLFRRLGLQPMTDFGAAAAAALAGRPVGTTRRLLDRLVEANLLQQRRAGRYELHDLVREYAANLIEQVDPAAERDAAYDRYLEWWVQTTANARKTINLAPPLVDVDPAPEGVHPLGFDDYDAAFSWFETEQAGLPALVTDALARKRPRAAHQLVVMATHYLHHSRALDDLVELLRLAVDAARTDHDDAAEATICNLLGSAYNEQGDYEQSRVFHERALTGFEAVGHDRGQLATLNNLGSTAFSLGRMDDAAEYCRRSHTVARRLENPLAEVLPLNMLATAYIALDRHDEAVAACRTALEIAERHEDATRTAAVLDTLGQALAGQDQHDEAIDSMRRSASLFESLRDRWSVCIVSANLGRAYRAIGRDEPARQAFEQALEIFDEIGGVDGPEINRAELVAMIAEVNAT